jgi:hypothetical protein
VKTSKPHHSSDGLDFEVEDTAMGPIPASFGISPAGTYMLRRTVLMAAHSRYLLVERNQSLSLVVLAVFGVA